MAGRPRTRYAFAMAHRMLEELYTGGPATGPELLDRLGYSHDGHGLRDAEDVAIVNMAVRELVAMPAVALDIWSGRLMWHRRGTRMPGPRNAGTAIA
jgi:hypothetical protein